MEQDGKIDAAVRRGRGAVSNAAGRFEPYSHVAVDDGWDLEEDQPVLRTQVSEERVGKIITHNRSPDVPFDRSINPYRGCEHGCIYCFARPTHAWLGLSPGLDFETKLVARPDAPAALERALRHPSYRPEVIAIGTNTDPYQPIERDRRIMRGVLEVLAGFGHPVGIATKGVMVERDVDILAPMSALGLARVGISLTTLDRDLARTMEPRVPGPTRRLRAIERLAEAGIEVRVMVSPIIPGLTDHEIETIVRAAADAGAKAASMIPLRLPHEVAPLFEEWLAEVRPDRAKRVMARVREMHGGKAYDARFGHRMRGAGQYAELMRHRFVLACKRAGLAQRLAPLRTDLFRAPPRVGDQMELGL